MRHNLQPPVQKTSNAHPGPIPKRQESVLVCWLCNKRVPVETAKTDENGAAMHEDCYLLRLHLREAC